MLTWQRCSGLPQLAATFSRVSGVTCGRSAATTSAAARANAMATTPGRSNHTCQHDRKWQGKAGQVGDSWLVQWLQPGRTPAMPAVLMFAGGSQNSQPRPGTRQVRLIGNLAADDTRRSRLDRKATGALPFCQPCSSCVVSLCQGQRPAQTSKASTGCTTKEGIVISDSKGPACASAEVNHAHVAPGAKRRRSCEQLCQQEGRLPDDQAHVAEVLCVPRRRRRLLPCRLRISPTRAPSELHMYKA
jgi:hypothetical protein